MKQSSLNSVLFNVAGLGLVVFLGAYMIQAALHTETVPRCSTRYGNGQQFSLQNGAGVPMTPIELQARLPSREWGLLSNARVVSAVDKGSLLQVALGLTPEARERAKREADPDEEVEKVRDGVGFLWRPQNIEESRSACLTYRVYLSKGFAFDGRGTLPGLYAVEEGANIDASQPEQGFVSRLGWDQAGSIGVSLKTPLTAGMWIPARGFQWPVNRWVTVEQEVVLNTPQKRDGVVRIWVDGALKIEHTGLDLGAAEGAGLGCVVADIGSTEQVAVPARVTLSPFIVQAQ